MKNLFKVVAAIVISGAFLTSCTKDNTAPTISGATISATSALPGDTVTFTATFGDTESEMDNAVLSYAYNGAAEVIAVTEDLTDAGGSKSFTYDFVVPSGAVATDTYTFNVELTDVHKNDVMTDSYTFGVLTVISGSTPLTVQTGTYKLFNKQGPNGTGGMMLADGSSVGSTSGDLADLTVSGVTTFDGSFTSSSSITVKSVASSYYAISDDETVASTYTAGTTYAGAAPTVGDVFIAYTGTTYYVLEVASIFDDAATSNDDYIEFNVKM
jgi:hypothetical protein